MRLAMKPGVSLHRTTVLPSDRSANRPMIVGCVGAHVVAHDDFKQLRETWRVEEVRDHEIAGETLGQAEGQRRERQRRRVGGNDRARLTVCVDLAIDVLLDADVFVHGLDDPVAIAELAEIILEVAASDEAGSARERKAWRVAFLLFLDRGVGQRVAVRGARGDHVQQDHVDSRVGHLCGDAAAHDACADDGDFFDSRYMIMHAVNPCAGSMNSLHSVLNRHSDRLPFHFATRRSFRAGAGRAERPAGGRRSAREQRVPRRSSEIGRGSGV